MRGHPDDKHMKFILLLVAIYFFYRYFLSQPKPPIPPPQEPDQFIDHEEVKREHEKNK